MTVAGHDGCGTRRTSGVKVANRNMPAASIELHSLDVSLKLHARTLGQEETSPVPKRGAFALIASNFVLIVPPL